MRPRLSSRPARPSDRRVASPGVPDDPDVLVAFKRVALCGTYAPALDQCLRLTMPPVIMGHEFTSEIEAAGRANDPLCAVIAIAIPPILLINLQGL